MNNNYVELKGEKYIIWEKYGKNKLVLTKKNIKTICILEVIGTVQKLPLHESKKDQKREKSRGKSHNRKKKYNKRRKE